MASERRGEGPCSPRHKKIVLSCSAVLSRRHLLSPTPQLSCSSLRLHKLSFSRTCLVFSPLTPRYCPKTASSEFAPSGHCTQQWSQLRVPHQRLASSAASSNSPSRVRPACVGYRGEGSGRSRRRPPAWHHRRTHGRHSRTRTHR